jgi:GH15 family glucan-1,4-alpha-glucosidase
MARILWTSGSHHLRVVGADVVFRLTTDASLTALVEEQTVILDRPLAFILGPDESVAAAPLSLAHRTLEQTVDYWQEWVRSLAIPVDWQAAVIRAAITLKLCTFEDSGAVLAALTTSIPESSGPDAIGITVLLAADSFFVIQALNRLVQPNHGGIPHYLTNVIAQSPSGTLRPPTAWLEPRGRGGAARYPRGLSGMGPVRVGNSALMQMQHDVYGAVIMATSQFFYDARLISPGDAAFLRASRPWEHTRRRCLSSPTRVLGVSRHRADPFYSACMCWAACDRLARIAPLGLNDRTAHWQSRPGHEGSHSGAIVERHAQFFR